MNYRFLLVLLFLTLINSTSVFANPPGHIETRGLLDLFLPRKPLDLSKVGLNAFVNDPQFGSVRSQLAEVKTRLKVKHIRILFAWNDEVQPSSSSKPNYSFYDEIAQSIPSGVSALVILTGVPGWAKSLPDPRSVFVERWVKPTVLRYKSNARISAFQIWNEPNDSSNADNSVLGFQNPDNYMQTIIASSAFIKSNTSGKLVVNAATTAIAQNYPKTLDYNKALISAGITRVVDRYAIHFYGDNYQNVILPNGIKSALSKVQIPIWVTESGKQGATKQRDYVERTWTFLAKNFSKIERFYYYQFTEASAAKNTYGLKYPGGISDLYRIIAHPVNSN